MLHFLIHIWIVWGLASPETDVEIDVFVAHALRNITFLAHQQHERGFARTKTRKATIDIKPAGAVGVPIDHDRLFLFMDCNFSHMDTIDWQPSHAVGDRARGVGTDFATRDHYKKQRQNAKHDDFRSNSCFHLPEF